MGLLVCPIIFNPKTARVGEGGGGGGGGGI